MKIKEYLYKHTILKETTTYRILKNRAGNIILWHIQRGLSDNRDALNAYLQQNCSADQLLSHLSVYEMQMRNNEIAIGRFPQSSSSNHTAKTYQVKYRLCHNCQCVFEDIDDGTIVDKNFYCDDCYDNIFMVCATCGNNFEECDLTDIDGEYYCDNCRDDQFFNCPHCGEWHSISNGWNSPDGRYCRHCWGDIFGECGGCGEIYYQDDLRYSEDNDSYYCSGCYEDNNGGIHDHDFKPMPIFKHLPYEKNKRMYLGFELEVECKNDEPITSAQCFKDWLNERTDGELYFKSDGSLENGYEIVSHPMTLAYIHKNMHIKKMLKYLSTNAHTSYDTGSCGLHIHFNRNYYKDSDIMKLKTFFNLNKKHIIKFSKRKDTQIRQWSKIEEEYTPYNMLTRSVSISSYGDRYVAVNVNRETIEIRIFRGTLNYDRFLASLQFVDAVVNFIKESSAVCLFNGRSWIEFVKYVAKSGKYAKLYKYLCKNKMAYRVMFHKTYGVKLNRKGVLR